MIGDFLNSWSLFHDAYVSGWLLAVQLSILGVVMVGRDQIFLGAASAQASTLGIALVMWVGTRLPPHHDDHGLTHAVVIAAAVLFSALAALATTLGTQRSRESLEGRTGWVFLAASSLALLAVAKSPLGLDEIQRLLASSIIGATPTDVAGFTLLGAITACATWRARDRLTLLVVDPVMAAAVGLRVGRWERGLALWLGLCVGFAIHTAGLLFTFGCLVLPGLAAKHLCREVRPMFWVAPILALVCSLAGFVLANHYDLPPAQATVALMSLIVAATWLRRGGQDTSRG